MGEVARLRHLGFRLESDKIKCRALFFFKLGASGSGSGTEMFSVSFVCKFALTSRSSLSRCPSPWQLTTFSSAFIQAAQLPSATFTR